MLKRFLETLVGRDLPCFLTKRVELQRLRQLHEAGYVEARFFPEAETADQFAELRSLTPSGWEVLGISQCCFGRDKG